jgi:hypothetical protein
MLQSQVEALFAQPKPSYTTDDFELFHRFIAALNSGEIRSAEPDRRYVHRPVEAALL